MITQMLKFFSSDSRVQQETRDSDVHENSLTFPEPKIELYSNYSFPECHPIVANTIYA